VTKIFERFHTGREKKGKTGGFPIQRRFNLIDDRSDGPKIDKSSEGRQSNESQGVLTARA